MPDSSLGSAAWDALLIGARWILGNNWTRVSDVVGQYSNVVLVSRSVAIAAPALRRMLRRRRLPKR